MAVASLYELPREMSRAEVLSSLARIPGRLRRLVESAPGDHLMAAAPDGGWSAMQTVGHMRDAALMYSIRFRRMVFDDSPFLPNYDENAWVAGSHDGPGDLDQVLSEVAASRSDLVRVLSRLPESGWGRQGHHQVLGAVALEPYVRHQLAHEELHLAQVGRILLRQR